MTATTFRALVARPDAEPGERLRVEARALDTLPPHAVTVQVEASSLNYKDMLSAFGRPGITRRYPHTPGIDAAGTVIASDDPSVEVGAKVALIGYDLGMNTSGGLAERVRVPAAWVLRRPAGQSAHEAMAYGTAGLTAALCVDALAAAGLPDGDVVVTGARGGVGALAAAMLARAGHRVVCATRRTADAERLLALGVAEVVSLESLSVPEDRPMAKERWAGAVDTLGGAPLSSLLKSTRYGGAVAACGMAAGPALATSVFPFILRGVRLLGVDSVELPHARKQAALDALAGPRAVPGLASLVETIRLDDVPAALDAIARGTHPPRTVVDLT